MANEYYNFGMVPPPFMEDYYASLFMPPPISKFTPNTLVVLSNAVLTPPLQGELITRCRKPNGCLSVNVTCLPEKITKGIIEEAFARFGRIKNIRMGGTCCNVRFWEEYSVDQALLLSGYRIKIEDNDDPAYTGKLHVDYHRARNDEFDLECQRRLREREERRRRAKA